MNKIYADSVSHLKSLYVGFDDVIHDSSHSERVAANALLLADELGYKDKEFLELCALWHDAARTQGITEGHEEAGALMAEQDLLQRGLDKDTGRRVYEAIRNHKSSSSPTTIEGKIIRDADKLDIFAVIRWEQCDAAGWTKEYADDFRKSVCSMGKYPDAYTYDFTKQQFKNNVSDFLHYYDLVKNKIPQ